MTSTYQRAVGFVDGRGDILAKHLNGYSGNNGRAVILSHWTYHMVGNAGNGTIKGAQNIVDNTADDASYATARYTEPGSLSTKAVRYNPLFVARLQCSCDPFFAKRRWDLRQKILWAQQIWLRTRIPFLIL